MIDLKTLFPMVKQILPNESDASIIAGIKEVAKAHPDLNNQQAIQALVMALKQTQGQDTEMPGAQQSPKPFGEDMMQALRSK